MQVDLERLRLDVLRRHVRVDARVDADRPRGDAPLARKLRYRLGEHLDIELEAERGDMT